MKIRSLYSLIKVITPIALVLSLIFHNRIFDKKEALNIEEKISCPTIFAKNKSVATFHDSSKSLVGVKAESKTEVSALLVALKDEDQSVRYQAAEALGEMGAQARDAIPALISQLKNEYEIYGVSLAHRHYVSNFFSFFPLLTCFITLPSSFK